MLRVGLVGLGNMGLAIAIRLGTAFQVVAYDIAAERTGEAVRQGVHTAGDVGEAASSADVLLLSLPHPDASLAVLAEALPHLRAGSLVIETSTVTAQQMARMEQMGRPFGVGLVDAAILGGVTGVAAGEAPLLVGGRGEAVAKVMPVLERLAHDVRHLGDIGAGMAAKLVSNAVAHAVMVVLIEAAALASATGVSMAAFEDLMARDTALLRPFTHRFRERIRHGSYEGGMSTANARKDSALILDAGREAEIPLFALPAVHEVYEIAGREGYDALDYAAIALLWETWSGHRFTEE